MPKLRIPDIGGWPADKLSGRVLLLLISVSAVVFGLYYLVGYDTPFEDNVNYNAPTMTAALLVYIYLLLAAAVAAAVVAVVRGIRKRGKRDRKVNGIPVLLISYGTAALLAVLLLVTFAAGSAEPLEINGDEYASVFWLKTTDMFIRTSVLLIAVAVGGVLYGMSGLNRRLKRKGGR